ncbi:MAG: R2-like ligand-binding oxidase [Chloroflexi bacterium]|nr:MAG: R2-like ligand-binding oxidase [Chloroflexota bacterium]
MNHQTFVTTGRGLHRHTPPMRLYEKAKRLGIWNPTDIDFSQDKKDWQTLSPDEQDILLRLSAMFQAGEEAVTLDLLPLIMTIAQEGRLEEEMYLTTFLFEEAKHTDFFQRFIHEVTGTTTNLSHYHTENYRIIFYEALPQALQQLTHDPSPAAQIRAAVTYNMVVEGMLAETGYHAYFTVLTQNNLMPGQQQGIRLLKQDESRHIAYGIYLISRLVATDDSLWHIVEETMNELTIPALGVVGDAFACYDPVPFGLVESDFIEYAMRQLQKRIERLERARGASLAEIERVTAEIIERDDG